MSRTRFGGTGYHLDDRSPKVPLAERLDAETLSICRTMLARVMSGRDPRRAGRLAEIIDDVLAIPVPARLDQAEAFSWFLTESSARIVNERLADHLIRQFWEAVHEARVSPGPN